MNPVLTISRLPEDILDPKQYLKALRDRTFALFDRSKGGADDPGNWVACCSACNRSKDSRDMEEWYRSRAFFCEVRLAKLNATLSDASLESTVEAR